MNESPRKDTSIICLYVQHQQVTAYLIAPAAVLGPNHCPTSLPKSLPDMAMRWTLNGAREEGESKNQVKSFTYVANSGDAELMAGRRQSARRVSNPRDTTARDAPRPRCK